MAHVVTKICYDCRYTDCVNVCPVECFYADDKMLYIDPDDCIDCEACVTECPVEAIFLDVNVPKLHHEDIDLNRERSAHLKDNDGHITDREKPIEGSECITTKRKAAEATKEGTNATMTQQQNTQPGTGKGDASSQPPLA